MQYRLKELRARYDLTQAQMAEKLGISTTTYNAWERNFSIVRMSKAKEIAKIFDVKLEDISF